MCSQKGCCALTECPHFLPSFLPSFLSFSVFLCLSLSFSVFLFLPLSFLVYLCLSLSISGFPCLSLPPLVKERRVRNSHALHLSPVLVGFPGNAVPAVFLLPRRPCCCVGPARGMPVNPERLGLTLWLAFGYLNSFQHLVQV